MYLFLKVKHKLKSKVMSGKIFKITIKIVYLLFLNMCGIL